MKYFTREYQNGHLTDNEVDKRRFDYNLHINAIHSNLTDNIKSFIKEINLHDGIIQLVKVNRNSDNLSFMIRCGDLQVGYYDAEITYVGIDLNNTNLESIRAVAIAKNEEILYDEFDIDDGYFTHCYLCYPKYEFMIRFKDLRFSRVDKPDRKIEVFKKKYIDIDE
jgi:hypothetical protein